METKEYSGVGGKLKFIWRYRCVKLRLLIETVGMISIFSFGILLNYFTIKQWYVADHIMWLNWNKYNEAYIEYIWSIVVLPCSLYWTVRASQRLKKRWRK